MAESHFYIVSIAQLPVAALAQEKRSRPPFHRSRVDAQAAPNGKSPAAAPLLRSAWLFQSNPALYDLRNALRFLGEQVWSVSRYAKEIKPGDRVYLWEAGREGGIAGVAEVGDLARIRPEPTEQLPFARVAGVFAGERLRARLKILRVIEPPIPRQSIVTSPELSSLDVLRCARGTNFRLSLDQWLALNRLVTGMAA